MIVRQPNAQAVLRPEIACGSAAGARTSVISRRDESPMLRPTATIVGLTVLKPVLRLMAIGHAAAFAITKSSAFVFSPNQSIARGSTATPGSGLRIETSIVR